jgi:hypothetical protein
MVIPSSTAGYAPARQIASAPRSNPKRHSGAGENGTILLDVDQAMRPKQLAVPVGRADLERVCSGWQIRREGPDPQVR